MNDERCDEMMRGMGGGGEGQSRRRDSPRVSRRSVVKEMVKVSGRRTRMMGEEKRKTAQGDQI